LFEIADWLALAFVGMRTAIDRASQIGHLTDAAANQHPLTMHRAPRPVVRAGHPL